MRRLAWLALVMACLVAAPVATFAADDAAAEQEQAELDAWVKKLDDAKERLAAADRQLEVLGGTKGRGAHRRYPRGDAKEKYLADLAAAQDEQADAARALPELIEEARREGVPPGVLSDYEDYASAHPANAAADDGDEMDTDTESDSDLDTDTAIEDDMGTDTQEESDDS
jgi:hypothetical protein